MKHFRLFNPMALLLVFGLSACSTTESHRNVEVGQTRAAREQYNGPRSTIVVGKFDNRSSFMNGIFSDGEDRLGSQAKNILITHLQQTNRFTVLDRDNTELALRETEISGQTRELIGGYYLITGDVSEFGRKEVGDYQLWGILGRGKKQVAYARINLNIIDTRSSALVWAAQGAGEYELSQREILGFGSSSSYDATLNGKVLDLAIREAIDSLVDAIYDGRWNPAGI